MDPTKEPGIHIGQILVLRSNFAHRADVLALAPTMAVELPIQIEAKVGGKEGDPAALISLRAYTPPDQLELLYSFDVEMVALVGRIEGKENLDPHTYATEIGPTMLFPFLREAVAAITGKGRFGAVWLKPMNLSLLEKEEAEVATP